MSGQPGDTSSRPMILFERKVSLFFLCDTKVSLAVITYRKAEQILAVTPRAARQNVDKLVESGLVREVTNRERNKIFLASEIVAILEAEQ